jgi:RNA polymerase sigma factor (sigma-70 family)
MDPVEISLASCHPGWGSGSVLGVSDNVVTGLVAAPCVNFDAFYESQFHTVLRVVGGITPNLGVANEVTQEAFLAAHRHWSKVSGYDRPELWVRRVAINRALSFRRRAANEAAALAHIVLRREPGVASTSLDSDVWAEVRRLPGRQASMIALVYIDDLSIPEAAEVLGISVPTAKTHLQRARRTLADRLNEELE